MAASSPATASAAEMLRITSILQETTDARTERTRSDADPPGDLPLNGIGAMPRRRWRPPVAGEDHATPAWACASQPSGHQPLDEAPRAAVARIRRSRPSWATVGHNVPHPCQRLRYEGWLRHCAHVR